MLITPASYSRENLTRFRAVTIDDGIEFRTINNPRAIFTKANGKGFTISALNPRDTVNVRRIVDMITHV